MSNLQQQLDSANDALSELVDRKRRIENSMRTTKKSLNSWVNGGLQRTINYNNYKNRPSRSQDAATLQRLRNFHLEAQQKISELTRTYKNQENTVKSLQTNIADKREKIESISPKNSFKSL